MCICSGPAHLAATRIYAGEFFRNGQALHTLIYQNEARNQSSGPNCMLLHIPSADVMTRANATDVDNASAFLTDLISTLKPVARGDLSLSRQHSASVQIFDYGIYTVVLSRSPAHIISALSEVPEHKRPTIQPALMDFYAQQFPGWTLALCCFNNRDQQRAQPLVWWYRPMFPTTLFAPGIDAHTGHPPDLAAPVVCDHEVIFGTNRPTNPSHDRFAHLRNRYAGPLAELIPRLATYTGYATAQTRAHYRNADFALELDALLKNPWSPIERRILSQPG